MIPGISETNSPSAGTIRESSSHRLKFHASPLLLRVPHPMVTVNLAVFSLVEQSLRVLLIRRGREPFAGKWAIPGGFLEIDEPAEARRRELRKETGLEIAGPVEPIGFFAKPGRDPRGRTVRWPTRRLSSLANTRRKAGTTQPRRPGPRLATPSIWRSTTRRSSTRRSPGSGGA